MRFTVTDREAAILAVNLGQFITDEGNSKDFMKGREGSAALSCDEELLLKMLREQEKYFTCGRPHVEILLINWTMRKW